MIDFYSSISNLVHQPGENVRLHLLNLERAFEKLLGIDDKLPESHKIAITLASVKRSPEFSQLFYSAKWLKRENLTLKLVKESIIAVQDSANVDRDNQQQQTAHASWKNKFKRQHQRRPQNPQKGWGCKLCQMDNHTEAECFKKNRPNQGKTFKKQSHAVQSQEDVQNQEETTNVAQAFQGTFLTTKNLRSIPPSGPIKSRLGEKSKTQSSPYQGIYPHPTTS